MPEPFVQPQVKYTAGTNGTVVAEPVNQPKTVADAGAFGMGNWAGNPFAKDSSLSIPGSGVSSSSSSAETAIGNLGNNISGLAGKPPAPLDLTGVNNASAEAQQILKDQQDALAKRREQAIKDIETSFNQTRASTEQAQVRETGQTSMGLARVGGFDSLGGAGVLQNLAATQRAELQTLQDKRQAAINAAQNAFDDKSFQLSYQLAQEVKGLDQEIYKRSQDYLTNLNKAASDARDAAYQNFNMQKDQQDFVVKNGITSPMYLLGGNVYDSKTKQQVDPSKITDWTQVQTIDPNSQAVKDYVKDLATKYADAGIKLDDTVETAQAKLSKSRIYKESIRPPQGGSATVDTSIQSRYNLPSTVNKNEYNAVRDFILTNKAAHPEMSYYDLWGQIADGLKGVTINGQPVDPSTYDGLFWDLLAPIKDGKTGYQQWEQKVGKANVNTNTPFWMIPNNNYNAGTEDSSSN